MNDADSWRRLVIKRTENTANLSGLWCDGPHFPSFSVLELFTPSMKYKSSMNYSPNIPFAHLN